MPTAAPLDPQAQGLLAALAQMPAPDFSTLTAAQWRAALSGPSMFAPGDAVAAIDNRSLPGPNGPLALRLYRPAVQGPLPVTLYFHGGGFVACGLDTHDNICRTLAARAGTLVVSVDYALAPEAPFPAAVEDALFALDWLDNNAAAIGGDATRIAVAGDSAGGNLAAVLAQLSRRNGPRLRHQLLLYPVTDCADESASYAEFASGYMLRAEEMRWYRRQYLPDARSALDPRASPLRQADLAGLAPATVITAECDPLRDEGEAYAAKLSAAGVAVEARRWPGQIHGFASMLGVIDAADAALSYGARRLRDALA
jgi:acetyl esterase